ncbi:hypothetical protein J2X85_004195 [Microbacterium trichothecenolyticum]|uniref:Ig-like domain repeat protein n=1 Tax=Microbacterium trichothecenolyticum TaxID=69370 RepID=UPI0028675D2D|nr:Ig-like domain repeat protein [Microbacterium trichothecenolyticum]MDR7187125.1 hypothetical protein [Microbacterium trichothecenolyticum]
MLLGGAVAPAAAITEDDLNLGPQVVKTDDGPTGYSVTFRYKAPADVQQVRIWGEWQFSNVERLAATRQSDGRLGADWQPGDTIAAAGPGFFPAFPALDMTLGEDGVWSWTSPLPSGKFSYRFVHDCGGVQGIDGCTSYPDPANPNWANSLTPTGAQTLSSVWVPSHPEFPTYDLDMQKPSSAERTGTFEHREYVSPESTNPVGKHYMAVYLPAGYDEDRAVPYPTLYLSHGAGGNEGTFFVQTLANDLMENIVAAGRAQPMVIVTTNFNGIPDGDAGYTRDLKQNVIPFVEREYNVSTKAADRAFGGQSMGGARAIGLLYNSTPTFEYYGLWAAAGGGNPNAAQVDRMKQMRGIIHVGTGLQDTLGNIGVNSIARAKVLRDHGLNVMEYNTNGTHTWVAARPLLQDFIESAVFRSTETSIGFESVAGATWASATVKPIGSSLVAPTGTVEFRDGDTVLGRAPVSADGTARLRLGPQDGPSATQVAAHYAGDALFNSSASDPVPGPDTQRPTVALVSPTTAGPTSTVQVQVDAADAVGLAKVVANVYSGSTLVRSTQSAVASGATTATHRATLALPDGIYTVKYNAHDLAGNVSKTGAFAFSVDGTKPTATIKDGASYTVKTGETYDRVSFKLYDAQKVDKVVLNGVTKDLTNNAWSDVNFIAPGTFGAVKGANTLVVFDVAGNTATYSFTLN